MANTTTTYANIVTFRLTPAEFVLEFGAFFPDRPGQTPPSDFKPDVRVVLPAGAMPGMIKALSAAMQQRQQQAADAAAKPQPKPAPGFQGPSGPKDTTS